MMSLFSSFDYKFYTPFSILMILTILNLNSSYFVMTSKKFLLNNFTNYMGIFFLSLKPKKFNKMIKLMALSIMLTLTILNLTSVASYNFADTSQISIVLFMSLSIWLSYILFSITQSLKNFIAHCIPEGTPIYLTWFLFIIEIVSNLIRPLTITVRLTANILAGHLLMNLLSTLIFKLNFLIFFYIILNLIEMFVSLIQAYIFVTMMMLYYSEL